MADVELTPAAAEGLEALNEPIHTRVLKILERLKNWPDISGAKPLSGPLAGRYRLRTGDYRVQFHVEQQHEDEHETLTVIVEKIGHRDRFDNS